MSLPAMLALVEEPRRIKSRFESIETEKALALSRAACSVPQRRQQFVGPLGHHHVAGAAQHDGS
jgi:hypothetical protein